MQGILLLFLCATYTFALSGLLDARGLFRRAVTSVNGVPTLDGIPLTRIPARPSVAVATSGSIDRTSWTVSCDSFQVGNECQNAIDGNANTFWAADTSAALPHTFTIDMKTSSLVGSVTLQPRQDGNSNGNIGQHTISLRFVLSIYLHFLWLTIV